MTKHSIGPWAIGREYSNSQDEIEDGVGRTVSVVWTRIAIPGASARPQFKDVPYLKANARLIAAAPAMLEALQRIVRQRDYAAEHGHYEEIPSDLCFDDWAADIAAEAIDLATDDTE